MSSFGIEYKKGEECEHLYLLKCNEKVPREWNNNNFQELIKHVFDELQVDHLKGKHITSINVSFKFNKICVRNMRGVVAQSKVQLPKLTQYTYTTDIDSLLRKDSILFNICKFGDITNKKIKITDSIVIDVDSIVFSVSEMKQVEMSVVDKYSMNHNKYDSSGVCTTLSGSEYLHVFDFQFRDDINTASMSKEDFISVVNLLLYKSFESLDNIKPECNKSCIELHYKTLDDNIDTIYDCGVQVKDVCKESRIILLNDVLGGDIDIHGIVNAASFKFIFDLSK